MSTDTRFPLNSRDADDAARTVCGALDGNPGVQREMHKRLSARYRGAKDIGDMQRILGEVHAEVRKMLPDGGES